MAEENYTKLISLFNEKYENEFDKNLYFRNSFVTRNNIADKNINYFSNISLNFIHFIFSNKNESIKNFINSKDEIDSNIIEELKKTIFYNFILKSYANLYFTNISA